jgi:CRP-like cAMP-binding protein
MGPIAPRRCTLYADKRRPQSDEEAGVAMEAIAAFRSYRRGQEICGYGDLGRHWMRIVSGLARACVLRADGRRQIMDFLQPDDFCVLVSPGSVHVTVEAVVDDTVVALYPRDHLERLADADPQLARRLHTIALETITRLQRRLLTLGPMTASERVGSFLIELADRALHNPAANRRTSTRHSVGVAGPSPRDARTLVLRMSRYDIADYLGLSAETVSRAVTNLKHQGAISLAGTHRVRIVDRSALDHGLDDETS